MLEWLSHNYPTIITVIILICAVTLIIAGMIKDKKQGKHSCGSSCSCCPMAGKCHPTDRKESGEKT